MNDQMLDGEEFFSCRCGSAEHTMRFVLDLSDINDPELYTEMYLSTNASFWKRLQIAVKYLFNMQCTYGHFDNWILRVSDAVRLRNMCNILINSIPHNNIMVKNNIYDDYLHECETAGYDFEIKYE